VDDPRIRPEHMLMVGRMFERSGDRIGAVVAYREVVLGGDRSAADEARRRLRLIAEAAAGWSR
jgi:hypothetical protein